MKAIVKIQNLKCGGCANTIRKKIGTLDNIHDVMVDVDTEEVSFDYDKERDLEMVKEGLSKLGYPLVGETNPKLSRAKSYVSCAIGRLGNEK